MKRPWPGRSVLARSVVALAILAAAQIAPQVARPVLADCDTMGHGVGVPDDARGTTFTGRISAMTVQPYEISYTFDVQGVYAGAVEPQITITSGICVGIGGLALGGHYLVSTAAPDGAGYDDTLIWRLHGPDGRDATLVDMGQPVRTYPRAVRAVDRLGAAARLMAPQGKRHMPRPRDRTTMAPLEVTASTDGVSCFGGRDCIELIEISGGYRGSPHFGAQVIPAAGDSDEATLTNGLPAALPFGDYLVTGTAWSTPMDGPISMSGTRVRCEAPIDVTQARLAQLVHVSFAADHCVITLGHRAAPLPISGVSTTKVLVGLNDGFPETVTVHAHDDLVERVREARAVDLERGPEGEGDAWGRIIKGDDHLLVAWLGTECDTAVRIDIVGSVVSVTRTEPGQCSDEGVVHGVVITSRSPLPSDIGVFSAIDN